MILNCRCTLIPLSVEDAAARGVREALRWVRTGKRPARPAWVRSIPVQIPPGWSVRPGVAAVV